MVTREVRRSSLNQLCPAIFLTVLIIFMTFVLPDPDVSLSILVCDVEHTSAHFITTIPSTYYVAFHMPMSDTDKMYVRHQTNSSLICMHTVNK